MNSKTALAVFDHRDVAGRDLDFLLVRPVFAYIPQVTDGGRDRRRKLVFRSEILGLRGKINSPPGQTLGGTSLAVSTHVMSLIWELKQWRDELDQRLSPVVDGAFAYWLPSIREERCNF